jgi:hypothetical protein
LKREAIDQNLRNAAGPFEARDAALNEPQQSSNGKIERGKRRKNN